jgi:hypothetical protein
MDNNGGGKEGASSVIHRQAGRSLADSAMGRVHDMALSILSPTKVAKEVDAANQVRALTVPDEMLNAEPTSAGSATAASGMQIPWELGVLLAVMGRQPTAIAKLYATVDPSQSSFVLSAGVRQRLRRAAVLHAALDFVNFWRQQRQELQKDLLSPQAHSQTMLRVIEKVLHGLRLSPIRRPGLPELTDVTQPVNGGLWYLFDVADMLAAVSPPQPNGGSTVAALQLHWPSKEPMNPQQIYEATPEVLDIIWWAVLIIPLIQRVLREWSADGETNNGNDEDDDDDDGNNNDDCTGEDGNDHADKSDQATGASGRVFAASYGQRSWRARTATETRLQQLRDIIANLARTGQEHPLQAGLLTAKPLIQLLFQQRQQQLEQAQALVERLLDPSLSWRASLLRMAQAWSDAIAAHRHLSFLASPLALSSPPERHPPRLPSPPVPESQAESQAIPQTAEDAATDGPRPPPARGFGTESLAIDVAIVLQAGALTLGYAGDEVFEEACARSYVQNHFSGHRSIRDLDCMQPFRHRGPSFEAVQTLLGRPPQDVTLRKTWFFRWVALRLFAWGKEQEIKEAVGSCHDTDSLYSMMTSARGRAWPLFGAKVYGRLSWGRAEGERAVREQMSALIDSLWHGLGLGRDRREGEERLSFAAAGAFFNNPIKQGNTPLMKNVRCPGILSWHLRCDFVEHFPRHLAPPTAFDLAKSIINAARNVGGGSGPLQAVGVLRQDWWEGWAKPKVKDVKRLAQELESTRRAVLRKLPPAVLHYCSGHELSWMDMEHSLCKVTRSKKYADKLLRQANRRG